MMRRRTARAAVATVVVLTAGACAPPRVTPSAEGATTVVVVRHAEQEAGAGNDPSLSELGRERAAALAEALAGARVVGVYSTQYRRTRETAEAVARALGLESSIRPIDASNASTYADALVAEILATHAGGTVLAVGHSNTVPQLVKALGGGEVDVIPESEYDRFYVLVIDGPDAVRAFAGSYGRETH